MCGIFFCLKKSQTNDEQFYNNELDVFKYAFNLLNKRGPDDSSFIVQDNKIFGFKRLAINDLSVEGNQPFFLPSKNEYQQLSMCNGELYNHVELENKYKLKMKSHSDCECIVPLYKLLTHTQNRIERKLTKLFNEIDGVFSMLIYDNERNKIIVARDRIGVKPMFIFNNDNYFIISSEAKTLDYILTNHIDINNKEVKNIIQMPPRSFGIYNLNTNTFDITEYFNMNNFLVPKIEYLYTASGLKNVNNLEENFQLHVANIHNLLYKSVYKRLLSDRPIGCLLSGGVDSSIIASILSKIYKKQNKKIKTFSIGFPDSTDLKYARIVAEYIQSEHHEYIIQYNDALKAIPDVINAIETYDITTIRASTPMYLLCKWIKDNFKETVIFSGEGSDEVFGGYLYFHNSPNEHELHRETIRLVSNLHLYDVLRADRCTSGNSLELREPFLDKDLIDYVCSIIGHYKKPHNGYEKYILRKAFKGYLPDNVLWRKKAAFSDAVSGNEKPWFKYIQEYSERFVNDDTLNYINSFKKDNEIKYTKESYWYLMLFRQFFPSYTLNVDYWLPKWSNTTDPSATTIDNVYDKKEHQ